MSDHVLNRPIGELGSVDGWKQLPISECGERLVPLGAFSNYPQIATDSIYAGERNSSPYPCEQLRSSMLAVFVREGVAERLAKATELLPSGHMLLVWDASGLLLFSKPCSTTTSVYSKRTGRRTIKPSWTLNASFRSRPTIRSNLRHITLVEPWISPSFASPKKIGGRWNGSQRSCGCRRPARTGGKSTQPKWNMHEFYPFVRDITMRTGHLKHTVHPQAAAL